MIAEFLGPLSRAGRRPVSTFERAKGVAAGAALALLLHAGPAPVAAEGHGPWVLRKAPLDPATAAGIAPEPAGEEALRLHRAARARFPSCDLIAPGSHLGILRAVDGRREPARGAPSRRADLLRRGPADDLALGKLAELPAPGTGALAPASVPGQDTIRILVLRVDFLTDRSGSQSTGNGRFDLSPPDTINVPVDPTPHDRDFYAAHMEALRRYYEATTRGRLVVEYDIYPQADSAYHTGDMADYGPWTIDQSEEIFDKAARMFTDFIVAADTQDTSIPWDAFDRVTIVHAGSDFQSDVNQDSPNDIPTFTIGLPEELVIPVADSTLFIQAGMILPETVNQDGFFASLNAVNAHEMGHLIFGWRDVYNVFNGFPTCGLWTLMDVGNIVGTIVQTGDTLNPRQFFAVGVLPPQTDPYQMSLIWEDVPSPDPPAWGEVDSLGPMQVTGRVLKVPLSSEEYLLLEKKADDLNGDNTLVLIRDPDTGVILGPGSADSLEYDFLLPGPGILAWHVDASVVDFFPPGRRADDFFTINGQGRKGLQIVEADGLDDLGDFTSPLALGSPFDPFFLGNNAILSSDGGRPRLTTNSGTDPHVTMEVLDSLRITMRLRVSRSWATDGWPVVFDPPAHGAKPLVLDFAAPVGRRVVVAAGDSTLRAFRPDGAPGGPTSSVLWQAPASLSHVAELVHATLGPLAVAAYPDPAALPAPAGAGGSEIVAVTGAGLAAPGFPVALPEASPGVPEYVTAGPAVSDGRIYVGTRSGRIFQIAEDGAVTALAPSGWQAVEGEATLGPILALALFEAGGSTWIAAADSLGNVAVRNTDFELAASGSRPHHTGDPAWSPQLAWVELSLGSGGATQDGEAASPGTPELVVLDRDRGAGAIHRVLDATGEPDPELLAELLGLDAPLAEGLAAGDLDGDGFHELVIATTDGRVGFWNRSGGNTPGWPGDFEPESFATRAAPLVADLNADPRNEIVAITGGGRLYALDRERRTLPGWPLGTGAGQIASPALLDLTGDGDLELLVADAESLLHAFDPPVAPVAGAVWPLWGGDPGRRFALADPPASGGVPETSLLVAGSLKCYPNPARRRPVTVSFALREPAQVRLAIYDASGRRVAELQQSGLRSDNHLVWDPSAAAPGLYLGRLEIEGAGGRETRVVPMAVLR